MRKHTTLGLLLLAPLAAGPLGCSKELSTPMANPGPAPSARLKADLFIRDQPLITGMAVWQGQIVVQADRFYLLDPVRATATPVTFPGTTEVVALASEASGRALALCRTAEGLRLLAQDGAGWAEQPLPQEVKGAAEDFRLLADSSSVVLLSQRACFRRAKDTWAAVPLKERPVPIAAGFGGFRRYLLAGDLLYEGYDAGEWGGGLLSLDLRTGEWGSVDYHGKAVRHLPVRDLQVRPDGAVWVVEGLAHLGLAEGSLWVYRGGAWDTFVSTERISERTATPWNLPPTSMDGVAFGEDGSPYVLAENLGVVRYDGTGWRQLTPGWPGGQYVSCFRLTRQGVAVIGMLDAGVLLWDLRSNEVRRVPLREPGDPVPPGSGAPGRIRLP